MKKLFLSIGVFRISSFGVSFAGYTQALDGVVDSMCQYWSDLDQDAQVQKYRDVVSFLTKVDSHLNTQQQTVALYIKTAFQKKIDDYGTTTTPSTPEIKNVDVAKLHETRFARHNTARANKSIAPYTRDEELSATAYARAQYLAGIDRSTHQRSSSDGYYNYESIKQRFANKGVKFDESNGTAFSESIARNYYSCAKDDCTQDLTNAIKKGFDFFMSEASRNGPHYRGVVNTNHNKMGMGVAFVGKRYYIVTHYGKR